MRNMMKRVTRYDGRRRAGRQFVHQPAKRPQGQYANPGNNRQRHSRGKKRDELGGEEQLPIGFLHKHLLERAPRPFAADVSRSYDRQDEDTNE
jgi:hypothetical protein